MTVAQGEAWFRVNSWIVFKCDTKNYPRNNTKVAFCAKLGASLPRWLRLLTNSGQPLLFSFDETRLNDTLVFNPMLTRQGRVR